MGSRWPAQTTINEPCDQPSDPTEVRNGVATDPDAVYVTYRDERAEWTQALPALRRLRDEKGLRFLAEAAGLSERALRYALNGGMVPHKAGRAREVLGASRLVASRRADLSRLLAVV